MFKKIIQASKITFESFLSGVPARDYVFQSTSYDEQIKQAAEMIKEAEYCLIGAGAGLSAAAGAQYGGKFFEDNFGDFQKNMEKVHICRTCILRDFILIQMKKHTGDTGRNRL